MPAVLVIGPNVWQNSLFLPKRWPKPSPVLTDCDYVYDYNVY